MAGAGGAEPMCLPSCVYPRSFVICHLSSTIESPRSSALGRERLDRDVDRLGEAVPEGLLELLVFAAGQQQALVGPLGQHGDDRLEVGLEEARQVLELAGQVQ